MYRGLAPRETVPSGFFERTNAFGKRVGSAINGLCLFDFGNEGRAYDRGVRQAAENGNMAGQ